MQKTSQPLSLRKALPSKLSATRFSFISTLSMAAVWLLLGGNSLLAASSKISPELAIQSGSGNVTVIVQFNGSGIASVLSSLPLVGGVATQTFSSLNLMIVSLPIANLPKLAANPTVVYLSTDRPLTQLLDYSAAAVNASSAKAAGLTGLGIGVAVIDSGIAPSPDLAVTGLLGLSAPDLPTTSSSRIVYRQSFVTGNAFDGFGHGTHVAGIIAGSGVSSECSNCTRAFVGIAPKASLIDLQVLNAQGAGTDSGVIAAIDRAIQLKSVYNIRVINLSLGRPIYETYTNDPLCVAVEAAWKAGIVVTVAAGNGGRDNSVGNDGYGTIQSPANDPYVITVGAMKAMGTYTRTDDLIASYSSKGPSGLDFVAKPDLVAPGNQVVSLQSLNSTLANDTATDVPLSYYEATNSSIRSTKYMMLNGTSMATPVVTGAVADLLQGQPGLTPDQVKARLMKTAYKVFPTSSTATDPVTGQTFTSQYDIFTIGAGYLDIEAALANHDIAVGNAMSPTASYNAANGKVYLVFNPTSTWNKTQTGTSLPSGVWSTSAVWGTTIVGPDQSIWGTRAVWGSSSVGGFQSIWGARGVWGTETDMGNSTVDGTRAVWGATSTTTDSNTVFTVTP